ncbi:ABC transporter permease subunit [Exiguobacterium sp. Helios]|jgi:peptide/nickel transport system permease protein|uniref:ABC transporter permease n=1 Tax=Exiguobacterium sp. Helios TaxID=2735868 RepID=UPI00165DC8D6|nr:ABC transporter permease subunit [Exiguobacterium sp. Helios]QNR21183.1 ABC transporter permease subunit [Exiguobacterium sp. Helios]
MKRLFYGLLILIPLMYLMMHSPYTTDISNRLAPVSKAHWLGTDALGRDFLARLIVAGLISLLFSGLTVLLTACIGTILGLFAGYYGGLLQRIIRRIEESLIIFPDTVLALVLAGLLGAGMHSLIWAILLIKWVSYARLTESIVTATKQSEYIWMARVNGLSDGMIIRQHLLAPVLRQIRNVMSVDLGKIILFLSAFSYIGLGVQAPVPEWGALLNEGRPYFQVAPRFMLWPGLCIVLTVSFTMWWNRRFQQKEGDCR